VNAALPPPVPPAPPALPAASGITNDHWRIIGYIAAGLILIGSFLPWASITTGFGRIDVAGTDGDGKLTAIGAAVIALGFVLRNRWLLFIAIVAVGVVAALDYVDVSNRVGDVASDFATASVGIGLYMIILGAIGAFVAALQVRSQPG
jgi:hypothetical protein